jgi:hypothetical protein
MRSLFLAALLGLALAAPRGAAAAPAFAPRRDLTDAERLEYSVTESDAVGLGTIRGVVDALIPDPAGGRLVPYRYVVFAPERWLKGGLALAPVAVGFDDPGSPAFAAARARAAADSARVLVFLRRNAAAAPAPPPPAGAARGRAAKDAAPAVPLGAQPVCAWLVDESPYLYGGGMTSLREGDAEAVLRTLDAAARSRTLESLVVTSTLAVLGTDVGETPCRVGGRDGSCARVRIDQMLAGSTLDAEIPVYSLLPDGVPEGQSLFFVRATGDGPYEILSFSAGVMPVRGGRVEPLGKPLADVQATVLRIVREQRGPGD